MATRPAAAARALKGGLVPGGGPPGPGREGPRGGPACGAGSADPRPPPCPLVSCRPGFPELLLENEEKPQQEDVFRRQRMCVCVFLCVTERK